MRALRSGLHQTTEQLPRGTSARPTTQHDQQADRRRGRRPADGAGIDDTGVRHLVERQKQRMATSATRTHEVSDLRPLRRLALASGVALLAAVIVVIASEAAVLGTRTWMWLPAVWFAGAIAALLLTGAVTGLWRHRHTAVPGQQAPAAGPLRTSEKAARHRWNVGLSFALCLAWALTALAYRGSEFWLHIAFAASYLIFVLARRQDLGITTNSAPRISTSEDP